MLPKRRVKKPLEVLTFCDFYGELGNGGIIEKPLDLQHCSNRTQESQGILSRCATCTCDMV